MTLPVLSTRLRNQSREPVTASMKRLKLRLIEAVRPKSEVLARTALSGSVDTEGKSPVHVRASWACSEATIIAGRAFDHPAMTLCSVTGGFVESPILLCMNLCPAGRVPKRKAWGGEGSVPRLPRLLRRLSAGLPQLHKTPLAVP